MANHKSAEKRARQSVTRTLRNTHFRSQMKTIIKDLRKLISEKKPKEAQAILPKVVSVIASTAQKKVIKKTTASRYISRLSSQVYRIAHSK